MSSALSNISVQDLKRAVALREHIEQLENELAGILGSSPRAVGRPRGSGRRFLSPEARERIAAAQRLRWSKHRKAVGGATGAASNGKKRRTMSAAARARIAAAARERWAKAKAKGQRTLAA